MNYAPPLPAKPSRLIIGISWDLDDALLSDQHSMSPHVRKTLDIYEGRPYTHIFNSSRSVKSSGEVVFISRYKGAEAIGAHDGAFFYVKINPEPVLTPEKGMLTFPKEFECISPDRTIDRVTAFNFEGCAHEMGLLNYTSFVRWSELRASVIRTADNAEAVDAYIKKHERFVKFEVIDGEGKRLPNPQSPQVDPAARYAIIVPKAAQERGINRKISQLAGKYAAYVDALGDLEKGTKIDIVRKGNTKATGIEDFLTHQNALLDAGDISNLILKWPELRSPTYVTLFNLLRQAGVEYRLPHYGWPNLAAFGNGPTDIPVLELAGIAGGPSNSDDEVLNLKRDNEDYPHVVIPFRGSVVEGDYFKSRDTESLDNRQDAAAWFVEYLNDKLIDIKQHVELKIHEARELALKHKIAVPAELLHSIS